MGGVSRYSVRKFCRTLLKVNVHESLSASLISGIEKLYAKEGYIMTFLGNFLSHSTKNFVWETFCYRKFFWIRWLNGVSRFSIRNVLSLINEKIRNPSVFHQFQVSKNVMLTRGMSNFSAEILLSRTVKKLCMIRKFG